MKKYIGLIALALPLLSMPVNASEDLAKSNKCMMCHKMDTKGMGPSLKDIAAKYKGQDGAAAMLAKSTLEGSTGKWGAKPMMPQKLDAANAHKLAEWILSL
ncbi:MAG: hypothetical protein CVU23_00885 [Betaproteobacteria bacterium HGW-Betaproteobacteria-17]|nr:MAG: hypothetical protein CVU23_00885 [Betaproteobacteria bacterium HGW-Betaproteobacteria-17]